MTDTVRAPAAATAQGPRKSDPATSEIGSEHKATNGHAQASPNGNGADVSIPKHTKRRRTKSAITDLRTAIKELLEHSHPQTVRQVYYALSVKGLIGKTETEYKMTVVRLLVQMRERGEIPFEWIADHTRATYGPTAYRSVADCLRATAKRYRRQVWADAECRVYVFCEKDALAAVLGQETDPYDVPLCVARGYSSISYLHEIAKVIESAGKPAFVYHFADHDPSGQDAARDTEEKLKRYALGATIHFERVAVTAEQIDKWNLPSRPTKTKDTRAKKFGRATSVELDAIPVDRLRALVRSRIKRHVNKKRLKALRREERRDSKFIRRAAELHAGAAS
jgi:hypothetical protein